MKKDFKFEVCQECKKKGLGKFKWFYPDTPISIHNKSDMRRHCKYCNAWENYFKCGVK